MKVQQHSVKLKGSNDNVINDWLWIDYHDRVNVLVQDGSSSDQRFLIFRQTKYALEGRTSLAIVGGIVEPGESPEHTAEREVEEELGRSCKSFDVLGRFRTDVNR
jgi:8-oxo-dGTP pyrophosphatase MutT (NUDIX family)